MQIRSVCVYCGSSEGTLSSWKTSAHAFGMLLAERGIRLVYGGGAVGLMGAVADGALAAGGSVVGVIPSALMEKELGHPGLTELHVVSNMHERKLKMADLADAFVSLPGGIGTLEELFETFTWKQLSFHEKPCSILNLEGYYDSLMLFLKHAVESGYLKPGHLADLIVETEPKQLLERLANAPHRPLSKWQ